MFSSLQVHPEDSGTKNTQPASTEVKTGEGTRYNHTHTYTRPSLFLETFSTIDIATPCADLLYNTETTGFVEFSQHQVKFSRERDNESQEATRAMRRSLHECLVLVSLCPLALSYSALQPKPASVLQHVPEKMTNSPADATAFKRM